MREAIYIVRPVPAGSLRADRPDAALPAAIQGRRGTALIYGAVMLYGTDPLPPRPAEPQLSEDQH